MVDRGEAFGWGPQFFSLGESHALVTTALFQHFVAAVPLFEVLHLVFDALERARYLVADGPDQLSEALVGCNLLQLHLRQDGRVPVAFERS